MLRRRLWSRAEPLVAQVLDHPFWAGLRDGTLPPQVLWHFAEQDARYTVPAYARALARTAAAPDREDHGALLAGAACATFESLTRMSRELTELSDRFEGLAPAAGISPSTLAHTSFMTAAATESFAAGIGGLLPMTWFHQQVCLDLRKRQVPGARYEWWIDQYCPEDGFHDYVEAYLEMIDDFGRRATEAEVTVLADSFLYGARYELAFCEAAWRLQGWAE
ncbi:TenA family transcriptional regulator [Kitasatospora sp. MMS16-BH015]|uniref:TenA family protein n=1 Tax=Kitasatospora sp. MMS16-BH015 TaxID=2018025 RepID=UPI000CA169EE|nr:TenA family transcriptional regulator [Kitasatospora sp. MMS16-BH015]AUG78927.1 TenA family transcriptional regulator [Kitasatospora sp. MMS16-BH015]